MPNKARALETTFRAYATINFAQQYNIVSCG